MTDYDKFIEDIHNSIYPIKGLIWKCFDYEFSDLLNYYNIDWVKTEKSNGKYQTDYIYDENKNLVITIDYTHALTSELEITCYFNKIFVIKIEFNCLMLDLLFQYYKKFNLSLNKALNEFSCDVYNLIYQSLIDCDIYG